MATARACVECGAPVESGQGMGLCASCVIRQALELPPSTGRHSWLEPDPTSAAGDMAARPLTGDYDELVEIARGGMGVVFRARQRSLGRHVALKVLLAGGFAGPEGRKRLLAEASMAAGLRHPNIVAVHDTGEMDGQPFFAMEYVEGRTLSALSREGPLPARRAAAYLVVVAEAVHYAHTQGVLHRDLKPSNILIDHDDRPRITDFGLAKAWAPSLNEEPASGPSPTPDLTQTGHVVGSPAYMAPEQALGARLGIGPATDVYSLGAILYELLVGRPPFQGETPLEILAQVRSAEIVGVRRLNASVPVDLETICHKCLEKEPSRRYPSAALLAEDLRRFLNSEPVKARPVGAAGRLLRWARRHPSVATLAVTCLGLLGLTLFIGVVGALRIRASRDDAQARLAESLISEGRALRLAGELGHREQALRRFSEATKLDVSRQLLPRLRHEAIAALARHDARRVTASQLPLCQDLMLMCIDPQFQICALAGPEIRGIGVFALSDGRLLQQLGARLPDEITSFSLDGSFLALRYRGSMAVCHIPSGTMVLDPQPGAGHLFNSGAFSHDGRWFARAEPQGIVAVYPLNKDHPAGKQWESSHRWATPGNRDVDILTWSPQGDALALSLEDATIVVCDVGTGRPRWEKRQESVWAMAWNRALNAVAYHTPPSRILFLSADDGAELRHLSVSDDNGSTVAFSPSGLLMATSSSGLGTHLQDPITGRILGTDIIAAWHLQFDPSGRKVGTLFDEGRPAWLEWDPSPVLTPLHSFTTALGYLAMDFDPRGGLLMSRTGQGLILWSLPGGETAADLILPSLRDAKFDSHRSRVVASRETELLEFQIPSANESKATLPTIRSLATGQKFWTVAVAPNRGWIAAADVNARLVTLIDSDGHNRRDLPTPPFPGYVAFSPDERWLACGGDTSVLIWNTDRWHDAPRALTGVGEVVRFSPDGRWLVTLGRQLELWHTDSWTAGPSLPLKPNNGALFTAAFSPNGRWLAATQKDQEIHLVDLPTQTTVAVLTGPGTGRVVDLAFGPDGRHLAAARAFGEIQLWDLVSLRAELRKHSLDW